MLWRWLLLAAAMIAAVEPARILAFFPFPAKSHHFVFRPILEELCKRGHEVVYVTGFPYEKPPKNMTQISIVKYFEEMMGPQEFDVVTFGEMSVPMEVIWLYMFGTMVAPVSLGNPEVQKLIHSDEKFEAVMFESYFVQEYQSAFIHKFGAVGIEVLPLGDCAWVNELSATPDILSYQLDYKHENTNELSFWDKLYNIYVTETLVILGYGYLWYMQSIVDKYFNYTGWETRPPLGQLVSNRSIILTNSHFSVGYSVPLAPHRKEIGGINVKQNKPLPKDLQTYLDGASDGVIYMSLGSNINVSKVTNNNLREDFMSVFSELPQRVLMKWEDDKYGKLPPNVKVSPWLPQQDILAHKNVVLFITHGGFLSICEAVNYGVPLVGIPFFGDQPKNMIQVETAGYGRMLRYRNLTRESISWAIKEVLSNRRYKEEAMRRSKLFRDRRHSPAEEAAYWVEYAIKYPNVLTPKGAYLSVVDMHLIDVKIFIIFVIALLLWLAYKTLCLCCSKGKSSKPPTKKLKQK